MFNPTLMEKVVKGQLSDRLHDAEIHRLHKRRRPNNSLKLKLSAVLGGVAVVVLMVTQLI